eukprot:CAMPEP_0170194248 /NCGR_PEP_ID=MMETSP0040_2-20121228/58805_1 /TAXON_ID=641309 /ORGANISM="Lotharella oceanica, Strain CCMP622" /LENGTH=301 /DNA_ID=CAMNT_0010443123 /DNA_START=11 /DNA_END=917 /DNA_ORIENTATION=-
MSGMLGSAGVNGVAADIISQQGGRMVKSGTTRLLACLDISSLKVYFAVDNAYVLHKIRLILCPFRHANWRRSHDQPGPGLGGVGGVQQSVPSDHALYKPPSSDVNAPDLYIPTMGFITYILLLAYALGLDNRFNPEVLSLTASWAMVALMLEVMVFWGGLWFLNVETAKRPYFLDLLAYTSYKFLGIIVGIVSGLMLGTTAYYVVTILFGITMGIFLMKSLNYITEAYDGSSNQRRYFLAAMGIMQVFLAVFLSAQPSPREAMRHACHHHGMVSCRMLPNIADVNTTTPHGEPYARSCVYE